jgi:rod shape-determining protein MreC
MSYRRTHNPRPSTLAIPWRILLQRYAYVFFCCLAFMILLWGRAEPEATAHLRASFTDRVAPVLHMLARPALAYEAMRKNIERHYAVVAANEMLQQEVSELRRWQQSALALQHENDVLKNLLHYKTEPSYSFLSARVIADVGGPFGQSLIITAGRDDGVKLGMAAMNDDGLIGRVVEVGAWTSRLLLITDLNSRIPVMMVETGDRAIMGGDQTATPMLHYLSLSATPAAGARIVTSGHGGLFPPYLPIGTLQKKNDKEWHVMPAADLSRLHHVRLVDFSLKGGELNPYMKDARAKNVMDKSVLTAPAP